MKDSSQRFLLEKRAFVPIKAPCPYVGDCGGCSLQDIAYQDQLVLKRQWVVQQLRNVASGAKVAIEGLEEPWHYRNKVIFSFAEQQGRVVLGYHLKRSSTEVIDIEECLLLPDTVNCVARFVLSRARASGLTAGVLRKLLIRMSPSTGEVLACLITGSSGRAWAEAIAPTLMREMPEVKGILWAKSEEALQAACSDQVSLLCGKESLQTKVGPYLITFHALNFLQASLIQADRLYSYVREHLPKNKGANLWDVYCGIGLVGLYLASNYRNVYGIEQDALAVDYARKNAQMNGIRNIMYHAGSAGSVFKSQDYWLRQARPEVVVVDPPRVGLQRSVIRMILEAWPEAIAYISCNMTTLVRDLKLLCSNVPSYKVDAVRVFDMFPQTEHIETVAILKRKKIHHG